MLYWMPVGSIATSVQFTALLPFVAAANLTHIFVRLYQQKKELRNEIKNLTVENGKRWFINSTETSCE